ncbi:MAG TPA: hypothetical protein V6C52_11090 [Coleofasciculaceae cyanobacterium]|jgi:flagellar biosynthesis protein FlhB
MKSCSKNYIEEMRGLRLSTLEKVLLTSLLLMCLISAVDSFMGRNIGDQEQLRIAKQQAKQELMALRTKSE